LLVKRCKVKNIALVIPGMACGGAERVMSELAHFFVEQPEVSVSLILLTKSEKFYPIPSKVKLIEPSFEHRQYSRFIFTLKIFMFLRKAFKGSKPNVVLSFGSRYNSFVLLASFGLGLKVYVSDRSRPSNSHGWFLDLINPIVYRFASGIIGQTQVAQENIFKKVKHRNIKVIGNPISKGELNYSHKQNIILNVGRFIPSKQQAFLVKTFAEIDPIGWKLVFLGDGPELMSIQKLAQELEVLNMVEFLGNVSNINNFYQKAKIFAFTSISEGFPNALGEAMAAGLACISFDCEAGPRDIIDHKQNGFLVDIKEKEEYKERLKQLILDEHLRFKFGREARLKMEQFSSEAIAKQYFEFLK
jgi:GalNAc-alpha-(1->4)-GalNAc-alpha-(1->3)-diNAcBac-PP-undecaprenol alpha-1,4-N-acetyl-D-galactosaminyltransferase